MGYFKGIFSGSNINKLLFMKFKNEAMLFKTEFIADIKYYTPYLIFAYIYGSVMLKSLAIFGATVRGVKALEVDSNNTSIHEDDLDLVCLSGENITDHNI
jgi:hypothetical protein